MEDTQNPFRRLHDLLSIAREKPPHIITLDVWAGVFNFKPSDMPGLVKSLSLLMGIVDEARTAAERFIPGDKTRFLVPLDRIDALIANQNLTSQWGAYKTYLDDGTMIALDFGIYAMSQYFPGAPPESAQQIRDFIEKLDTLLEECLSSELTPEIKKLFTRHLESLRAALLAYRVDGLAGLEAVLDNIVGSLHRNSGPITAEPAAGREFIKSFFDVLGKVNDMVSGCQTATQLAGPAMAALFLPLM